MAYLDNSLIQEIKSKNDIVDVISSYISLNDKNKGLCPFHNDHSASLSVHKEKQIFKCFSCGASGNVITFVEKFENCSYNEAIDKLAQRVGIKLNIKTEKKVDEKLKVYYDINNLVSNYYKNNLLSNDGKKAIEYLEKRNITKDIINDFNIGLSLNNSKITDILSKKFNESDLLNADISKEYNNELKDSFQNRIVFPIIDEDKNVLAFSGRKYLEKDLNNDELPKYYNTKETKVFIKSKVFYNINNALEHIIKNKEIIICEGQMDAIRLYSIGYKNVVALMGTAFTKEHLEKILKYKCNVVLNLDQDMPGKNATINIGEILIKNNIDTHVIVFQSHKDSDEFIVHEGKSAFDIAYNNKVSFIDFKLKYLKDNSSLKDTKEISKYINEAIKSINELNDDIERELKIKELSKEFGIHESIIQNKITNTNKKEVEVKEIKKTKYNKYDISELRLLYLMLNYDDVITMFENRLGYMINDDRASLAYRIIEFRNYYDKFNYSDFIDYIKDDDKILNVLEEVNSYYQNEEYNEEEIDDYINTIKSYIVLKRKKELESEMKSSLDINKKIEIAKKIEKINKDVLEW